MTKKQRDALMILIENASANVAGTSCGIRPTVTDKRQLEVKDAIKVFYKQAYGIEPDRSVWFNLGLPCD
jgi:hypothetical protein